MIMNVKSESFIIKDGGFDGLIEPGVTDKALNKLDLTNSHGLISNTFDAPERDIELSEDELLSTTSRGRAA